MSLEPAIACPECGHGEKARLPANILTRALAWWDRAVWRLRPSCPVTLGSGESVSGHPEPCACPDLWHVAAT